MQLHANELGWSANQINDVAVFEHTYMYACILLLHVTT